MDQITFTTLRKKKRSKMALLENNFGNRLSFKAYQAHFMFGSTKIELHRELSYGRPNDSPRRAILALFFFSVHVPPVKPT